MIPLLLLHLRPVERERSATSRERGEGCTPYGRGMLLCYCWYSRRYLLVDPPPPQQGKTAAPTPDTAGRPQPGRQSARQQAAASSVAELGTQHITEGRRRRYYDSLALIRRPACFEQQLQTFFFFLHFPARGMVHSMYEQ